MRVNVIKPSKALLANERRSLKSKYDPNIKGHELFYLTEHILQMTQSRRLVGAVADVEELLECHISVAI